MHRTHIPHSKEKKKKLCRIHKDIFGSNILETSHIREHTFISTKIYSVFLSFYDAQNILTIIRISLKIFTHLSLIFFFEYSVWKHFKQCIFIIVLRNNLRKIDIYIYIYIRMQICDFNCKSSRRYLCKSKPSDACLVRKRYRDARPRVRNSACPRRVSAVYVWHALMQRDSDDSRHSDLGLS